jgi:hypothetical protein
MSFKKIISRKKYVYGLLDYSGKEYQIIFASPMCMLVDDNISWESKGYLSHIALVGDMVGDIDMPDYITQELIDAGYLVEVK